MQKIKKDLIRKAQIKKSYDRLKSREPDLYSRPVESITGTAVGDEASTTASLELHPERQAMLEERIVNPFPSQSQDTGPKGRQRPPRQPRPVPYRKEAALANKRDEERQIRQKAFEEANREKDIKREERERFRKAMAKARTGGRDGSQRKLGRESKVLLEKVQRIVNE